MAEQNILTGDLAVLDQIIGDLKEHRKNKEQLEKLNEIAKDLTKNIENDERVYLRHQNKDHRMQS
jgi:UDP-2,3-diacylglucosamine pyrophosphatase LpxH